MNILVSGASDDLIEIDGDIRKEFPLGIESVRNMSIGIWRGDFIAPNGEQARVYVIFDGCWHVSVGQVDEAVPLPNWEFAFNQVSEHSVQLEFDPPDGTRLTNTTTEE
jgi:hypothetical protein